jgi:hypothetical protein
VLPHIVAGDPGKLDLVYWTGQQDGSAIHWYTTIAQVTNALTKPAVKEFRVSNISADTGTASELMGACDQNQQTGGVVNGVVCKAEASTATRWTPSGRTGSGTTSAC